MKHNKILAVDPSGTGTTGVYYWNGKQGNFHRFTSKEWVKQAWFILELVKELQPDILLFENSNYVNSRGKDMTSLWKLMGATEALPYGFLGLRVVAVPVNQVKGLRGKLLKGTSQIKDLEYQNGKGWHYQGQKISVHQLDAYLVYWLWESKQGETIEKTPPKSRLTSKTMKADKMKQKTSQNNKTTCNYCDKKICVCWIEYHNRNKGIDHD